MTAWDFTNNNSQLAGYLGLPLDVPYHVPADSFLDGEYARAFALDELGIRMEEFWAFWDKFGFVCISEVLSETECDETIADFLETMGWQTGIPTLPAEKLSKTAPLLRVGIASRKAPDMSRGQLRNAGAGAT